MSGKSLTVRIASRLKRNKVWAGVMASTGSDLADKRWIFIVGCYNSGTTLLNQILSLHPEIAGIKEEGVMLTDSLPRPEDFGWRRMWHMCEDDMGIEQDVEVEKAKRIKRHWSHFIDKRLPFVLEKSISNLPRMLFFERNFKPCYFIHIVRNGYAVAEGIRRKASILEGNPYYSEGQYSIELCAKQWKRSLEVMKEIRPNLQNFIEVNYEDLTTDPDKCLNRICNFLRISDYPQSLKQKSFTVHGLTQSIANQNETSLAHLSRKDTTIINSVAKDELIAHNYFMATA